MTCSMCRHGSIKDSTVTVTLERGTAVLIFRHVPARVCESCGEEFISAEINELLLRRGGEELRRGVQLELLEFAA